MLKAWYLIFLVPLLIGVASAQESGSLKITEGPILLHANIDQQWGGHTFSYLLEGESALFWSASKYNNGDGTWSKLIGSYPKPGIDAHPVTTLIPVQDENIHSSTQPLIVRSTDGFIHVFFGVALSTETVGYAPGRIRYFRSSSPEDVSQLLDRTELLPQVPPYSEFHLRMNIGISEDGERASLVVLAISKDGSVPFNTPVIFPAKKQGPDFIFEAPVAYAEAMGLFYPQVAVLDSGTVIVGQVWDNAERSLTRLIHLDQNAKEIHREDLSAEADGNYWCCDLRPITNDRKQLMLYYNAISKDKTDCRHEFWIYDAEIRTMERKRTVPVEYSRSNYGKWISLEEGKSAFIHNPSMGRFDLWEGNLLGEGELSVSPLQATDVHALGYAGTAYTFVPNPLQGSLTTPGSTWFGVDYIPQCKVPEERGPCSFMLFRLERR